MDTAVGLEPILRTYFRQYFVVLTQHTQVCFARSPCLDKNLPRKIFTANEFEVIFVTEGAGRLAPVKPKGAKSSQRHRREMFLFLFPPSNIKNHLHFVIKYEKIV